ncbi:CCA tRNA nucleotidyltransferase [Kiloniella antarctica]|uniref:CCA tRNA nucleotidyltransferase n=1 Tax=Kiloniella antarctica TaxID=1550907 RepID=A0ABW5BF70_9PROT
MSDIYQLERQSWMEATATRRVMDALRAGGQDVRFVGGCVRDSLVGREIKDIDIATPDRPEVVITLLENAGIKAIPTGMDHGTITAVCNHKVFEITTLRLDVETDGRHAKVIFTDSWVEDAARRDLTMNALSANLEGVVYDPFDGVKDLREKRIRFVGDAVTRIEEDALRLLRFFRFQAWYGGDDIDAVGLEAARKKAPLLKGLSAERIHSELMRLLAAPDPGSVLKHMLDNNIFTTFLPEVVTTDIFDAFIKLEGRCDPLVRLVALTMVANKTMGCPKDTIFSIPDRLRFSTAEKEHFLSLVRPAYNINSKIDDATFREAIYRIGSGLVSDLLRLSMARTGEGFGNQKALELSRKIESWQPVFFPLQGRDLIKAGFKPGPKMGRLLKITEQWWIEQAFVPDYDQCLAYAMK